MVRFLLPPWRCGRYEGQRYGQSLLFYSVLPPSIDRQGTALLASRLESLPSEMYDQEPANAPVFNNRRSLVEHGTKYSVINLSDH